MREFQRQCLAALEPVLDVLKTGPRWHTVKCGPNEAIKHEPGDVYCRAQFEHAGHSYDLYVYPDEAGAHVDGRWFIYERSDCQNEDLRLIAAFTRFIKYCLSGTPAKRAYRRALRAE